MTGTVYRLLDTCRYAEDGLRRRVWLEPGVPMMVGFTRLTMLADRIDGEYAVVVSARVGGPRPYDYSVRLGGRLFLFPDRWVAVPRALELCPGHAPRRLLIEFYQPAAECAHAAD